MAKFFGVVGFSQTKERAKGVWVNDITEKEFYGDVIKNSVSHRDGDKVNDDLTVGNSISIVSDAYANEHFFAILFVEWAGVCWKVSNVDVQHPRLILRLGGVYTGEREDKAGETTGDS